MARLPRLGPSGWPQLLFQTGHNDQVIFLDTVDRALFRRLLKEASDNSGVDIHSYRFLGNEFRMLATPTADGSISRMMQSLGRRYGSAFNNRYGRTGSLWSSRFKATVLDPEQYLLICMALLEGGHEDADLTDTSSIAHHLGRAVDPVVRDHAKFWALGNTPFERSAAYEKLLRQSLKIDEVAHIERAVRTAWPLGEANFLTNLGAVVDRRVTPLKPGRKKKAGPNSYPKI